MEQTTSRASDIATLTDALTHLIGGDMSHPWWREHNPVHNLPPMFFDGFDALPLHGEGVMGGEVYKPVVPDLDVCSAVQNVQEKNDRGEFPKGSWLFNRVRLVNPKEYRGKVRIVSSILYASHSLVAPPDGRLQSSTALLAAFPGPYPGKVASAFIDPRNNFKASPGDLFAVHVAQGFALRKYFHWSVLLGEGEGPRARFLTDPLGCREVFR